MLCRALSSFCRPWWYNVGIPMVPHLASLKFNLTVTHHDGYYTCMLFLIESLPSMTRSWETDCSHTQQWLESNVPWTWTSFSSEIPANLSSPSMFWVKYWLKIPKSIFILRLEGVTFGYIESTVRSPDTKLWSGHQTSVWACPNYCTFFFEHGNEMVSYCWSKLPGHDFLGECIKWFWILSEEKNVENIFRFI